mmetsp:Transcript_22232/g.34840  ORF Transcript_22232/g.34840 Transcript_22232/m.34840 type:complete len:91 (+) Transcript_22232:246-518(+)
MAENGIRRQVVQALTPGGPAETNGQMQIGDVLQTIDGSKVSDMTDRELARNLLGPPGSKVTLGMQRNKGQVHQIDLERAWPTNPGTPKSK